jgi:kynurenine formamidase
MYRGQLFVFLTLVFISSCKQKPLQFNDSAWIDLTHTFDSTTLYWPNNQSGFIHKTEAKGKTPGGYFYSSYSVCAPEHGGTHLDAPIHFAENKQTVDQIPLEKLTGNAVLVDVSEKSLKNSDYLISIQDLEFWEEKNGEIEPNSIVLFRTGYGKFYPNRAKYFGTPLTGMEAIPQLHFPGIAPQAATWLIEKRKVKAVGLDTPSLDYGQSKDFKTHQILMGNNCPGFENLANLEKLPAKGSYIVALPMKIGQGSGAPLRIIANILEAN